MWNRVGLLRVDVSEERVAPVLQYYTVSYRVSLVLARVISSTLKMKATRSSETSVHNKRTRCHIQEDSIPHSHRRENLKSYIVTVCLIKLQGDMPLMLSATLPKRQ
jgi:translation elongation factor EF-G